MLFSKKKYNNIDIVYNGGWHFTNIKTAEKIHHKMKNFLHHHEYQDSGLGVHDIEKKIKNRKVLYDYKADQRKDKWKSEIELKIFNIDNLPSYIKENRKKFIDWLE